MADITVLWLTAPGLMGARALSLIESAERLFLQTDRHPFAAPLKNAGRAYESMDALYERAADFDALNEAVAARLTAGAPCVYAATGRIQQTQLPAIRRAADEAGLSVETLPGLPLYAAAFPGRPAASLRGAGELGAGLDPSLPLAVEEIDSAMAAGRVKLFLMEYFPDDWEIELAAPDETGEFCAKRLPLYELDRQAAYSPACCAYVPAAPFEALRRSGYAELVAVMRRLRAPGGCPWDREQTHASLKPALLEECYELLDAIDEGDDAHMLEELGDVLLQVVFHCVIAEEQGRFGERDVTTELVHKLVYRHPHIFSTVKADTAGEVLDNWERLKKVEKRQSSQTEVLRSVPRNLPALTFSRKLQKKAANVGFDWDSAEEAFHKIVEETAELESAMRGGGSVEEELGDLLFAVVNVARLLKLDPEFLLRAAADKFLRRFAAMEALAAEQGRALEGMSLGEMDRLWEKAKKSENGE
ncbi:MAG: nucleoside triphosphate pyrophosphohydrolase [Clostridia bacterium]|nr:nucleoside triphosphate pyrophosphohydrolase [Clostridia bacterium]